MIRIGLIAVLWACLACATTFAQATPAQELCPYASTTREWDTSCFDLTNAQRKVKKQHRNKLAFNRQGFATIIISSPPELVAINRRGFLVELREAHLSKFSFEPGEKGEVARFAYATNYARKATQFRCGFYRVGHFQVLVPPVYDQCDSFSRGTALVCLGCTSHCPSGDCHETDFVGGEGLVINEKNEILRRFALPTMPLCEDSKDKGNGEKPCRPRPPDPFAEDQARQTE